jgi:hypothetical protein
VCAEASSVLTAEAKDFFFNCWCLEIPSDSRIRHVPRCVQVTLPKSQEDSDPLVSTLLHAFVYDFTTYAVLVQIANKAG